MEKIFMFYILLILLSITNQQPTTFESCDIPGEMSQYREEIDNLKIAIDDLKFAINNLKELDEIKTKLDSQYHKEFDQYKIEIENLKSSIYDFKELLKNKTKIDCPLNFEYIEEGNKCYKYDTEANNWEIASQRCNSFNPNAHLIVINNKEENNIAKNFIRPKINTGVWMGAQTTDPKNVYSPIVWKPFAYKSSWSQLNFTDFGPNEPNKEFGIEACIHFFNNFRNMEWNDKNCNENYPALCEIDL